MINPVSRFDIPESVKTLIDTAIKLNVIDVFDVYEMATSFGNDYRAIASELCLIAHRNGKSKHEAIVEAAEKVWSDKGVSNGLVV